MKDLKTNKLVSVIMPVYNGERFFKAAIQSILTQTFSDFELIIIDDGSTDKSLIIAQSFDDKRIRIIQNPMNKGLVFSLNKGIAEAKGKYIARMDADDISMPERLEKQVAFLEKNSTIVMVGNSAISIDAENKQVGAWNVKTTINDLKQEILFGSPFIHPSLMIRRDILLKLPYEKEWFPAEDYFLWFKILEQYQVANLKESLLLYRIHNNKVSTNASVNQAIKSKEVQRLALENLGLIFTKKELNIHAKIAYNANTLNIKKEELEEAKNWLMRLSNHDLFKNSTYLSIKWWQVCIRYNYGFSTYKTFISSHLSNNVTNRKKGELYIRSLLISLFGQQFFQSFRIKLRWIKRIFQKAYQF